MRASSQHTTNYLYNALGQMIEKPGNSGTMLLMQDEAGHLIGEYSSTGALVQETIWLGDIPVATLRPNGSSVSIYYEHTDHLNAPRKAQQPTTDKLAWRWDADPFGTAAPNQNPASLGTFVYNLRFPGQYYMAETGLSQNYFRDFDPAVGRYVESDPIGLKGGSYSTYSYVSDGPTANSDPSGLLVRGAGISDPEWNQVLNAEAKIRNELRRSCVCPAHGPSGCIPCDLVPDLLNALDTASVTGRQLAGICGRAGVFSRWMILTPDAFNNQAGCSCLASTIYHELLHDVGLSHQQSGDPVSTLERQCMGNLCK
jgi:RHS repeat-associated protein